MLVSKAIGLMSSDIIDYKIVADCNILGSVLDSRLTEKGNIFFATQGEYFDGNDYVEMALERGASVVVMSNKEKYGDVKGNKILVSDILVFMKSLGAMRLKNFSAIKIVITGSFGKTSSKEMLKSILSKRYAVYATRGNKNNLLGVSLTACGIDDKADIAIFEIGSNAMGEIAELSRYISPDIAIVTTIGHAHIGNFGSIENTVREKLSVLEGMKNGGKLLIDGIYFNRISRFDVRTLTYGSNVSDDIYVTDLINSGSDIKFKVNIFENYITLKHPYQHVVTSFLPLILAARGLLMQESDIAEAISSYRFVGGRGSIIDAGEVKIIDDTYNAGYESMLRAVESLNFIQIEPKYAILGEMAEIEGFEVILHNSIADLSGIYPNINFIFIGNSYRKIENTNNRKVIADKNLAFGEVEKIEKGVVIIKASRSKHFEDFVKILASKHGVDA